MGRHQHGLDRQLDTFVKPIVVLHRELDEADQGRCLAGGQGTPKGSEPEGLDDFPGAGLRLALFFRRADQDPLAGFSFGPGRLHNLLASLEIFLHQQRRYREQVADVVESIADLIGGKSIGQVELDTDKIMDRIVVLDLVEPPHGDPAGIVPLALVEPEDCRVNPGDDLGDLIFCGPPASLRRHLGRLDILGYSLPYLLVLNRLGSDKIAVEYQLTLLLLLVVT